MAEGFKDFAPGDILTAADVDDYLMRQAIMVFADASARTTALSSVLREGMMSYLKDTNAVEVYDGSAWTGVGGLDVFAIDYLVVGGGGGGGDYLGGGGGAGGVLDGTTYKALGALTVTVGAGGAWRSGRYTGEGGYGSRFDDLFAAGGGGGAGRVSLVGGDGASGGGRTEMGYAGHGMPGQGFDGGNGASTNGGGGGGAGAAGQNSPSSVQAGAGGIGAISTIISDTQASAWSVGEVSGSDVYYGGGGGGGDYNSAGYGAGGTGGGGDGGNSTTGAVNGTANTGGGGGGEGADAYNAGNGGSGVVILKWLTADASISVGAGLSYSNTTVGDYTVYAFTAGTGTVTFS